MKKLLLPFAVVAVVATPAIAQDKGSGPGAAAEMKDAKGSGAGAPMMDAKGSGAGAPMMGHKGSAQALR
ncbi:MAG: hypothetical protein R3D68_01130 [Hyphomicrobiaceae bacterium]